MIYTVTLNPGLDRTLEVDDIDFDAVLRAKKTQLDWGGKGLNVARALKALGQESVAMGFLGGGTGKMLERGLQVLGIPTDFTWINDETRTNVVIQETDSGRHIKVNEAGPKIGQEFQQSLLERVGQAAREGDYWALCGSLPPGVPADFYARLVHKVHEKKGKAVLDTSGEALRLGCAAGPDLIKPNRMEAEQVVGFPLESDAALKKGVDFFLDIGIDMVAISLGKEGLYLSRRSEAFHARPPQVGAPGAAVGAGDALLAGLLWALSRGKSLEEVARWGVATGTAAAMRPGVEMGSRVDVEKFYQQVMIDAQSG